MSQPTDLQDELAKLTDEIDNAKDRARHRKEEGVGGLFPQEDESKADLDPNSPARP
jgi:hypothetical protein